MCEVVGAGDAPEAGAAVGLGVEVDGRLAAEQVELVVGDARDERVEVGEVDVGERERHGAASRSARLEHVTIPRPQPVQRTGPDAMKVELACTIS